MSSSSSASAITGAVGPMDDAEAVAAAVAGHAVIGNSATITPTSRLKDSAAAPPPQQQSDSSMAAESVSPSALHSDANATIDCGPPVAHHGQGPHLLGAKQPTHPAAAAAAADDDANNADDDGQLTASGSAPKRQRQGAPAENSSATHLESQAQTAQQMLAESPTDGARANRVDRVRDAALVSGVIALVLSFLPARERLLSGAVSRRWLTSLKQPTLWSELGCQFEWLSHPWCMDGTCSECCTRCSLGRFDLPLWVRSAVSQMRCGLEWLRSAKQFHALRSFPSLRRLQLAACGFHIQPRQPGYEFSISAGDISEWLRALRLQSLSLACPDPNVDRPLYEAIFGAAGATAAAADAAAGASNSVAAEPLLSHWAQSLSQFRCSDIFLDRPNPVLSSLHLHRWTELRSLSLEFSERNWGEPSEVGLDLVGLMRRAVTHACMPQLQSLAMRFTVPAKDDSNGHRMLTCALLAVLPQLPGLTDLHAGFSLGLAEKQSDGWLPGLHLLPALRVLRCGVDMGRSTAAALAASIAQAPMLEVLHVESAMCDEAAAAICRQMRLLCEAAAAVGSATVPLRHLHVAIRKWSGLRLSMLEAVALHDLAALPQLERLEGFIWSGCIPLLGSLRRLRFLRAQIDLKEFEWRDAEICALGQLRLPRLESLVLDSLIRCVYKDPKHGGDLVSASFSPLTVDGGLRYLLWLPSLTHVQLPRVSPGVHTQLIHVASAAGRAAIHFSVPAPPPPRYPRGAVLPMVRE